MTDKNKLDKVIAALDRYMLAKLKMLQMIKKTGGVSVELADEVSNAHDALTEEWIGAHTYGEVKLNL